MTVESMSASSRRLRRPAAGWRQASHRQTRDRRVAGPRAGPSALALQPAGRGRRAPSVDCALTRPPAPCDLGRGARAAACAAGVGLGADQGEAEGHGGRRGGRCARLADRRLHGKRASPPWPSPWPSAPAPRSSNADALQLYADLAVLSARPTPRRARPRAAPPLRRPPTRRTPGRRGPLAARRPCRSWRRSPRGGRPAIVVGGTGTLLRRADPRPGRGRPAVPPPVRGRGGCALRPRGRGRRCAECWAACDPESESRIAPRRPAAAGARPCQCTWRTGRPLSAWRAGHPGRRLGAGAWRGLGARVASRGPLRPLRRAIRRPCWRAARSTRCGRWRRAESPAGPAGAQGGGRARADRATFGGDLTLDEAAGRRPARGRAATPSASSPGSANQAPDWPRLPEPDVDAALQRLGA